MTQINQEIGERIRGVRLLAELTPEEFAGKLGIQPQQLALYEEGAAEIPVSFLHGVAEKFEISMTELLIGESAKLSVYSVVRKGKGVGVSRRQEYDYRSLAYNFVGRSIDPYHITITPRPAGESVAMYCHSGQEFHYVIDGSVRLKIAKYETILNEGDSVYFNSAYPHSIEAVGGRPAHIIIAITGRE